MSNNNKVISPIAIDLGGRYTGLYLPQYRYGESITEHHGKLATLVMPEEGGRMTWSQVGRTATRHRIRSYKRKKMAKRLIKVMFIQGLSYQLKKSELEAINGLFNRRGYNRIESEVDLTHLESIPASWLANEFPNFFDSVTPLLDQVVALFGDIPMLRDLSDDEKFNLSKSEAKKQLFQDADNEKPDLLTAFHIIQSSVVDILINTDSGHQHRRKYIEAIGKEILKDARLARLREKFGAAAITNLVGNVSNFQLRILRKYFNDTAMSRDDYFDHDRMKRLIIKWLQSWHVDPETQEHRNKALTIIHPSSDILSALMDIDPVLTIPPYEDQNNRRPPKDQTLWLNPQSLTEIHGDQWRIWVNNLRKRNPEIAEGILQILKHTDRRSRLITNQQRIKDTSLYEDSYFLQRILDRSKVHDIYALRTLSKNTISNQLETFYWNLKRDLGEQHIEEFLSFCMKYYQEVNEAKIGTWEHSSSRYLEKADINPPSKRKILHRLVGNILGINMSVEELESFLSNVWTAKVHGQSTVKSICRAAEDLRKQNGNLFNMYIQSVRYRASVESGAEKKFKGLDKEIWQLLVKVEKAVEVIAGAISATESQKQRFNNSFSLAQLYTLIETDRKGFSKVSVASNLELSWRMTMTVKDGKEAAQCSRLPADSIRPFDGVLRRLLERQAYEIATLKSKQIKQSNITNSDISIPIVIEENRFTFSIGLADVKKDGLKRKKLLSLGEKQLETWQQKNDRIMNSGERLCPYKGTPLNKEAELDHIIPRSFSRSKLGTIFNSEANLIFASRAGNQDKGNIRYGLADLSPRYLTAIYGTSDHTIIRQIIEETVGSLSKNFLYTELEASQQRDVRHALFLDSNSKAYEKVFGRLATQQSNRVNGTQAWLARKVIENLRDQLTPWHIKSGNRISFDICKADAQQTSLVRSSLAEATPETMKVDKQGVGSHAIDAYCAFSVAAAEGLHNTLGQGTGFMEDKKWLSASLPSAVDVKWIERKPRYRKDDISSQPIFKDGIYGESFLTTWVSEQGIESGFSLGSNSIKWQGKNTAELLNLLLPFSVQSFDLDTIMTSKKPIQITINKEKAFSHLAKVAKSTFTESEGRQADILDAIRYCTSKKDISSRLFDTQKKILKSDNDVLKLKDFTVKLDFNIKGLGKFKGKLIYPERDQWKRLFDIPEIAKAQGIKSPDIDWQLLGKQFFGEGSSRPHNKTRRVYSLPIIDSPSGGYRIKRNVPNGQNIWQLVSIDGTAASGFAVNEKGVDWKHVVGIPALRCSSVVGIGERYKPEPGQQVYFDDWLDLPLKHEKIISASMAPGTKDRRYIAVKQKLSDFKIWLADSGVSLNTVFEIASEIKVEGKTFQKAHGIDLLGKPRSNLFITKLGDIVSYWYIVENSSAAMNQCYNEALLAEKVDTSESELCDI